MVIYEKVDTNRRGFLKSVAAMAIVPALPMLPAPLAATVDPRAERRREALELLRGQPAGGLSWDGFLRLYDEIKRLGFPEVWVGMTYPDPRQTICHARGPDGGEITYSEIRPSIN